jgi:mRNA interferase RelE/StbE
MAVVQMTPEAVQQFADIPVIVQKRIRKLKERLTKWPDVSGAKPLTGNLAGYYRLRTGDYRLRFRVQGDAIIIDKIGHRKDFYED